MMRRFPPTKTGGFSLTEVVLSLGIIATVILPLLAMLANGRSLQANSEDRIAASTLAESIIDRLVLSPQADGLVLTSGKATASGVPVETTILFPAAAGEISKGFVAFNRVGEPILELEEDDYLSGISPADDGGIFFLVKIEVLFSSTESTALPMYPITLSIGQPAIAAEINRTIEKFSTIISGTE